MGNIFCDYDYDYDYDYDFSNDQIAIQSVGTPIPIPNTVIDDIMENWKKIQLIIEQSCISKKIITKEQLALWIKYYIFSRNVFKESSLCFPFKVAALGVLRRHKYSELSKKKSEEGLTDKEMASLEKISLELINEIKEIREICKELNELEQNSLPTS